MYIPSTLVQLLHEERLANLGIIQPGQPPEHIPLWLRLSVYVKCKNRQHLSVRVGGKKKKKRRQSMMRMLWIQLHRLWTPGRTGFFTGEALEAMDDDEDNETRLDEFHENRKARCHTSHP